MSIATEAGGPAGAGAGPAARLTLEQKASLTSGSDNWYTQPVPEAGVDAIMVADGPHGLRRQPDSGGDGLALGAGALATCFPPAVGLGSSWNPPLVEQVGRAISREAVAAGVSVVLGPGVNIKRSPLGGRNFEYVSEDPLLTGRIGAALVRGLQSGGVGASLKHFAANNQETDRFRVSAEVDERTLREIYLPAFEHIVTTEQPMTVMCSYNKINGVYSSQNHWLLTEVLREEWGFEGLVVSDWGAVSDRAAALSAGLDLEMPPPIDGDAQVVAAVQSGALAESALDAAVARVLALIERTAAGRAERAGAMVDFDAQHALAHTAALESAVLLKNDGGLLPLAADATGTLAVIGEFARSPRYQGGGSSHVAPTRVDNALDAIRALAADPARVEFAPGFTLDGSPGQAQRWAQGRGQGRDQNRDLVAEAVELAGRAETVLLFLGLPEQAESEGADRTHLGLPADQLALFDAVAAANGRIVVVLSNGSAVALEPWRDKAAAILEGWLLGQAGGGATARLLFGAANPSGKLTESLPLRLEDTPSHLHFPGGEGLVSYGEGIYVGYRYYDTLDVPVAYPFGHGLSYTTFEYSALLLTRTGPSTFEASFTVTNTGPVAGAEIAQLYVSDLDSSLDRPVHELKSFAKVQLEPGESATVTLALDERAFAYWSPRRRRWTVEPGEFEIQVGASSRDIRLRRTVHLDADGHRPELTRDATLGEWLAQPAGSVLREDIAARGYAQMVGLDAKGSGNLHAMAAALPLGRLPSFMPGVTSEHVDLLILAAQDAERDR
jgi:beta-glucosidase